jgi:hypothetical protein
MNATTEQFEAIRDEAWKLEHVDAMECSGAEELIGRVLGMWREDAMTFAAELAKHNFLKVEREPLHLLRVAEQALAAVVRRAAASVSKGYSVAGLNDLLVALLEARNYLLTPLAARLSRHDPEGRPRQHFVEYLAPRVRFVDGRPVISDELAKELPCPYPE